MAVTGKVCYRPRNHRWRPAPLPASEDSGCGRLVARGVLIGPYGLELLGSHHPVVGVFSDLGKLLLMFCAGLEVDLAHFRTAKNKVYVFGVLTAMVPQLLGTIVGLLFGYPLQQPRLFSTGIKSSQRFRALYG